MATRPQKTTNESLGQAAVQCFINTQSVVTSHGNKTVNTASPAEPDACESPTGAYYQHTFRHHAGPGTSLWEAARSKPRRSVLDQFLRAIVWMEPYTARLPAGYVCPDNPGRGSGPPAPHKAGTALDTECSLPPGGLLVPVRRCGRRSMMAPAQAPPAGSEEKSPAHPPGGRR